MRLASLRIVSVLIAAAHTIEALLRWAECRVLKPQTNFRPPDIASFYD